MGNERNAHYAGRWLMPNGDWIRVEYLDREICGRLFNEGVKRNSPGYRKIGWYWTAYKGPDPVRSVVAIWHGPFSASGVALKSAKERHSEIGGMTSARVARESVS